LYEKSTKYFNNPQRAKRENVGAMFRTADAAGIDKIYLTGYTPCPLTVSGEKEGIWRSLHWARRNL